ncbi:LysR family transcriptional regulator [Falsirhodobacter algicola]|uniref:LysR family transcriptional regulator n=1 Tax=Falsirhodobacter algicola TaxID=2692330 RepID=A0A8J8SLP6_9RHOB|nr:LysR family transcriptional regulator [Falsirhodobacter algicola]QUS36763.1 LysR family transcriptional regulator [Falsirhodobacter algicola]
MLNAQWIETFVTLCETGHFTRTAERLNMTQPGVSQQLRKLEEQVGQPLISRDGKRFVPTPAGEAVLRLGHDRRRQEQALRAALSVDDPHVGEVTLACSGSLAMLLYPQLLALMAEAPDLVIRLEAAPQARVQDGVLTGAFDLGIADHAPAHPRLEGQRAGTDELCLVLPAGQSAERFADLQARGFVDHPDGAAYAEALLPANFPDYRGHPRVRSFINQIGQIPEPVARGIGYTILPRSGVEAFARRDRLAVAALSHPVRHDLWLVWRRGRQLPARVAGVAARVTAALGAAVP